MAFGYYGSMGHRTWDEKYNREVAELAFSRLAPEEAFYVVAFETDTARIKALLESAGFAVSSEKVPHEEASRTAWI